MAHVLAADRVAALIDGNILESKISDIKNGVQNKHVNFMAQNLCQCHKKVLH